MAILNEALCRPELKFSFPIGDKYYVVDAGYPYTRGYLAPYKGTKIRYHILDFRRGHTTAARAPKGAKEKFNCHHSSLRNIIERTFGVRKARWHILKDMHVEYAYETQVNIVLASMAIHNYTRMNNSSDDGFNKALKETYNPRQEFNAETSSNVNEIDEDMSVRRRSDNLYMNAVRDIIAEDLVESR